MKKYVTLYMCQKKTYYNVNRGLVKWYNNGLQNHCWEFDSLIPCHLDVTPTFGVKYTENA